MKKGQILSLRNSMCGRLFETGAEEGHAAKRDEMVRDDRKLRVDVPRYKGYFELSLNYVNVCITHFHTPPTKPLSPQKISSSSRCQPR